jgi:hypothetical protein
MRLAGWGAAHPLKYRGKEAIMMSTRLKLAVAVSALVIPVAHAGTAQKIYWADIQTNTIQRANPGYPTC